KRSQLGRNRPRRAWNPRRQLLAPLLVAGGAFGRSQRYSGSGDRSRRRSRPLSRSLRPSHVARPLLFPSASVTGVWHNRGTGNPVRLSWLVLRPARNRVGSAGGTDQDRAEYSASLVSCGGIGRLRVRLPGSRKGLPATAAPIRCP